MYTFRFQINIFFYRELGLLFDACYKYDITLQNDAINLLIVVVVVRLVSIWFIFQTN